MDKLTKAIEILLDTNEEIGLRDDIAMDLEEFDNDIVLNTLIEVAKNINDDPTVLNTCGESIATIWLKKKLF